MKKLLFCLTLIFIMNSCSTEQVEIKDNTTSEEINRSLDREKSTLLLQWRKGISEADKEAFRDYYRKEKILISIDPCEKEGYETWIINKRAANDPNDPVDTRKPVVCCDTGKMWLDKDCSDI